MRKAAKTEKTGVFTRILIPTDLTTVLHAHSSWRSRLPAAVRRP
jgi:hypothetical protein